MGDEDILKTLREMEPARFNVYLSTLSIDKLLDLALEATTSLEKEVDVFCEKLRDHQEAQLETHEASKVELKKLLVRLSS
jgi:hypothetical protein